MNASTTRNGHPWRAILMAPLVSAVAACAGAPSKPTPIWMGALSTPDAPVIKAKVQSWKERKFTGLVRQRTDFSCGAAVLATVLNGAYDRHTSEQQVLVNMLRIADPDIVREKGFSLLDMKRYVQAIGMKGEGYQVEYDTLKNLEMPAIVLINDRGYKHFVVARKAFDDRIALGDPALGNRFMQRGAFQEAWNGIAFVVIGDGYDPKTALIDIPNPLSARRLLEQHAALPAAEAAEFGFHQGFSFSF